MTLSSIIKLIVESLGWVLIHSLWQFALVAVAVIIVERLLRSSTASLRYRVLTGFFTAFVLIPMLTWFYVGPDFKTPDARQASAMPMATVDAVSADVKPASDPPIPVTVADHKEAIYPAPFLVGQPGSFEDAIRPWLPFVVAIWLAGVALFLLRPAISHWVTRQYRLQGTKSVSHELQAVAERISRQFGLSRASMILESTLVKVPMVVGYLRPVVLLPTSVVTGMSIAQIEAILAHELAHVKRHDYLVNLVQTLLEALFFYHPAVWWLSRRIRIERENCCDDMAVAVTRNAQSYGRALLELEELRQGTDESKATLALAATDGSLAARIRRLLQPRFIRRPASVLEILAFLVVPLLLAVILIDAVSANEDDTSEWGRAVNGLACRIAAVSPNADPEKIGLEQTVDQFDSPNEITFAVELKNVSNSPITVMGVAYGKGFAIAGKPNPNHYAPHLFEFQFTNELGEPIQRSDRDFVESTRSLILSHVSTHEIKPGESHLILLKPAEFQRGMRYRLAKGKFRARVRYRGMDPKLSQWIGQYLPHNPQLGSWSGEIESNEVAFSIVDSKTTHVPKLVWGPESDGLRAAVEFKVPEGTKGHPNIAPGVPVGTSIQAVLHLKNVSDNPISFVSETSRQGDQIHVTDSFGKRVPIQDIFFTGVPIDVRWKLKPGDVAEINVLSPSIGQLKKAGSYTVSYTVRGRSRLQKDDNGNVIFPAPGDWQSDAETGDTPLFLYDLHASKAEAARQGWSTLKGRIVFPDGDLPDRQVFKIGDKTIPNERLLVNPKNRGIENAIVWMRPTKESLPLPPLHPEHRKQPKEIELNFQNNILSPHVSLLTVGQTLKVVNRDETIYCINMQFYANGAVNRIVKPNESFAIDPKNSERVPIGVSCSVKPWLSAYVLIQDHPYMACTDKDGKFEIAHIPHGEWRFQFWHEAYGYLDQVELDGVPTNWKRGRVNITFDRPVVDLANIVVEEKKQ